MISLARINVIKYETIYDSVEETCVDIYIPENYFVRMQRNQKEFKRQMILDCITENFGDFRIIDMNDRESCFTIYENDIGQWEYCTRIRFKKGKE